MLFTSLTFWEFFLPVFFALWINSRTIRSVNAQNFVLLLSSYVFYAAWDWRFLGLIALSTSIDYVAGMRIGRTDRRMERNFWLTFSIVSNLSLLGFFKYFNFFSSQFKILLESFGVPVGWPTLHIILPVGISFFTFQTMTYTIDVYLGHMKWERDLLKYSTYVAFFPQLVAGPIERARNLLPQFNAIPSFRWQNFYQGISLVIFGLFLKTVVADNLAPYVDTIFATAGVRNGGELWLGALYFAGQIYADFCGYSTIAIGVALMMGFHLMTNFQRPYFATSLRAFWRNWHISLSSFFRDYVYIPLGGSRTSNAKRDRNLLVTFVLSGLWHGANWTFVAWGFVHGLGLVIAIRFTEWLAWPRGRLRDLAGWASTMAVVLICWVFFRSPDITSALHYIGRMFTDLDFPHALRSGVLYVSLIVLVDFLWRGDVRLENGVTLGVKHAQLSHLTEALILGAMINAILFFSIINGTNHEFIYFQF